METYLPLTGMRVVEMGSSVAGPYAALILADMGAEVLKIEHPVTGDTSREWGRKYVEGKSAVFETMNRGKKSITVDMKDSDDVAALRTLIIDSVDIVLQNLRPGSVEEFGLDAKTLTAIKPSLIYCNSGAFGPTGPLRDNPGYDPLMQGLTGLASITGPLGGEPCRVGAPVVDFGTGMWNVIGILGLLVQRRQTGQGGVVDTSLFDTAAAWMTLHTGLYQSNQELPKRTGLQGPMVAPNSGYQCADGLLMIVCATQTQFENMCQAIGAENLLTDPRFTTPEIRSVDHEAFEIALNTYLSSHSRAYWAERLDRYKVPNAPVQTLDELFIHPQTEASGILQTGPIDGFMAMTLPLRFNGRRPSYSRSAPQLGEHNDERTRG